MSRKQQEEYPVPEKGEKGTKHVEVLVIKHSHIMKLSTNVMINWSGRMSFGRREWKHSMWPYV